MKPKNELPIPILKLTVGFNPTTGELWWLERGPHWFASAKDPEKESKRWNTRYQGKPAFNTKSAYGYFCGRHSGVQLYAHRVMWALMMDEWPYPHLDHIDGNKGNNKIQNLRVVDKTTNNRNAKKRSDNKTGFCGVSFNKKSSKYVAYATENGKQVSLGHYKTAEEAAKVAEDFRKNLGYSERHGREELSRVG